MEYFTPLPSLVGGILIGISATMMLALLGRIAGVSGIVGGMLASDRGDFAWRAWFLVGLVVGGLLLSRPLPDAFVMRLDRSGIALAAAGLLVGLGSRLGSGCTSGHGVCGIARASKRSFVATATFMATGAATAVVVTHLLAGRS